MIPQLPNPHDRLTFEEFNTFSDYYYAEDVITDDMCNKLIAYGEEHVVPQGSKHNKKFLQHKFHCFLPMHHEIHSILSDHWYAAAKHLQVDIEYVEPYDLKVYPTNGFMNRHIDNYHGLSSIVQSDRKISMSLQLTDEDLYSGGEMIVGYRPTSKKKLSATFFPSFFPHNVTTVTKGERWALVSWAWGPPWK